jgi:type II secretory ATPase GspE/PulE/Tfp pilus assembly ATPase PilB-like protein
MVGEIRDQETAEIAIRAALTGHVVFSTLHTNDAAGAVTRLIDMGVEGFLISSSLEGVLAQRLVRRICPACKREAPLPIETRRKLEALGIDAGPGPHFRGAGCDDCRGTGYRGRTGLFELLVITPELREMIVARRSATEIKAAAGKNMATLREDGLRKAAEGATTLEEVLRVAAGGLS